MTMKKTLALLLAAALTLGLAACSGGDERSQAGGEGSSQGSASQGSSTADGGSESETQRDDPAITPPTTQDEAAEYFRQALLTGNLTGIQYITGYDGYEDWAGVEFGDIEYQTIAQDFESARYAFTFHVTQSDSPVFPTGSVKRIVAVGYPAYGDHLGVTMFYDENDSYYELFPYDMEQTGYAAYSQVQTYVTFMNTLEFASTADIPDEELAEFAIILLSREYEGQREQFAPGEVNEMVAALFGVSGFDAASTRFYDAEEGACMLLGRGGTQMYTTTPTAAYDAASGSYTVDMTFYQDPLCTVQDRTVRYTLRQNGDRLQFVSAVAL